MFAIEYCGLAPLNVPPDPDTANVLPCATLNVALYVVSNISPEIIPVAVNVGADSFVIIDADDSNNPKKESIADLATAMAGTNLTASSGTLNASAGASVGLILALG